jgi:hypothetical protein
MRLLELIVKSGATIKKVTAPSGESAYNVVVPDSKKLTQAELAFMLRHHDAFCSVLQHAESVEEEVEGREAAAEVIAKNAETETATKKNGRHK